MSTTISSHKGSSTPTLQMSETGHKESPAYAASSQSSIHSKADAKLAAPKDEEKSKAGAGGGGMQAPTEVPRWRFWAIFCSLLMSIFLFALDQLILASASPLIVSEFNSLDRLPWLANGFFLTLLGFNLLYSQWATIFPSKVVILFAVFIFELGSLVCGVAHSMTVLILGRAISGVGASGIFSGGMIIIAELVPLSQRAQYFALFGVVFAISSIIGPLIGGAFADHVSWRWCFFINLPLGGLAFAALLVFQPMYAPLGQAATYKGFHRGMVGQVVRCDWVGAAISMAWAVTAILWLQWGGQTKKWSDGSVIACIVLSAVLIPIFFLYEKWLGDKAMFNLTMFKRRTIAAASGTLFFLFGTFMLVIYYLSVHFQAVFHASAMGAGVKLLPSILTQVFMLVASSRVIPKIGRFKYVICAGPVFITIGCGLLYSVKYGMSIKYLLGYEALVGIGIGLALQNSMLAIQHDLKSEPRLISAGTGTGVFLGFAGRILGLSGGGAVFGNVIRKQIHQQAPELPDALAELVASNVDAIWNVLPAEFRPQVLEAYSHTLRDVYAMGIAFAICSLACALCLRNDKMLSKEEEQAAIQAAKEKAAADSAEKAKDVENAQEAVETEALDATEGSSAVPAKLTAPDAQVVVDKQEGKSPV